MVPGVSLFYSPEGQPITLEEWAEEFRKDRIVERTGLTINGVRVLVSTVYLGSDHNFDNPGNPPLIFETMAFIDDNEDAVWRYPTIEKARKGHQRAVNQLRDSLGRFTLDGLAN